MLSTAAIDKCLQGMLEFGDSGRCKSRESSRQEDISIMIAAQQMQINRHGFYNGAQIQIQVILRRSPEILFQYTPNYQQSSLHNPLMQAMLRQLIETKISSAVSVMHLLLARMPEHLLYASMHQVQAMMLEIQELEALKLRRIAYQREMDLIIKQQQDLVLQAQLRRQQEEQRRRDAVNHAKLVASISVLFGALLHRLSDEDGIAPNKDELKSFLAAMSPKLRNNLYNRPSRLSPI